MAAGHLGLMAQPGNRLGAKIVPGVRWAADNGCFAKTWDPVHWARWLDAQRRYQAQCLFAAVPDVVEDHAATLALWDKWHDLVRSLGYRPAFVLQDGATIADVAQVDAGALFIGGSTHFKLSPAARAIAEEGRARGLWIHCGRVNTLRRLRYTVPFCDSVDGTFLRYGPDVNLPRLLSYLRRVHGELAAQPML